VEVRRSGNPSRSRSGRPPGPTTSIARACRSKVTPLTKAFRETVYNRAQKDGAFRKALLTEAVNAYLSGDEVTGKGVLRTVINATIGFEQLALELQTPSKSLHRMLGPNGNPNTANFFAILQVLQKRVGVRLTVKAA
jgi:hypothetical protein